MISDYILIQAEIALSFGIVGSIFAKDVSISFSYFLLPAIIGLLCIIPCIITYVKEDLTVKQIMIQRIVEWIVLEVAFIWIVYKMVGDVPGKLGYVANSPYTVLGDSLSAGRLYDRIGKKAYGKVILVTPQGVLCKVNKKSLVVYQKKEVIENGSE